MRVDAHANRSKVTHVHAQSDQAGIPLISIIHRCEAVVRGSIGLLAGDDIGILCRHDQPHVIDLCGDKNHADAAIIKAHALFVDLAGQAPADMNDYG